MVNWLNENQTLSTAMLVGTVDLEFVYLVSLFLGCQNSKAAFLIPLVFGRLQCEICQQISFSSSVYSSGENGSFSGFTDEKDNFFEFNCLWFNSFYFCKVFWFLIFLIYFWFAYFVYAVWLNQIVLLSSWIPVFASYTIRKIWSIQIYFFLANIFFQVNQNQI